MRYIVFDLETTGLTKPDIVQIGAIDIETGDTFDEFLKPDKDFEPGATLTNKLSTKKDGHIYKLCASGDSRRVYTREAGTVLKEFTEWLGSKNTPVSLIGEENFFRCT